MCLTNRNFFSFLLVNDAFEYPGSGNVSKNKRRDKSGVNISHYSLPNGYGIVSKFTEFSEKFSVLRSQKIEKIATFEEKNE